MLPRHADRPETLFGDCLPDLSLVLARSWLGRRLLPPATVLRVCSEFNVASSRGQTSGSTSHARSLSLVLLAPRGTEACRDSPRSHIPLDRLRVAVMPFRSRLSLSSAITNSSTQHGPSSKPDDMDPRTPYADEEDDEGLPRPVQASKYPGTPMRKKKTRLSLGAYFRWDKFLRKLGSGTAPSTSSAPDESSGESTGYNRSRGTTRAVGEDDEVDEVVVDREWSGEIKSSVHSGDHGGPEKSGSNPQMGYGGTSTDRDSVAIPADGFWTGNMGLIYLRYRIWPAVYGFFSTHFIDEKSENHYKKENWFLRKVRDSFQPYDLSLLTTFTVPSHMVGRILDNQLGPRCQLHSTPSRPLRQDILLRGMS